MHRFDDNDSGDEMVEKQAEPVEVSKVDAQEQAPEPKPQKESKKDMEAKFLPAVLLILQILGAIPSIIALAEKLWEMIKKVRDRNKKADLRFRFRKMVYGQQKELMRRNRKVMSVSENDQMQKDMESMTNEVAGILVQQGG